MSVRRADAQPQWRDVDQQADRAAKLKADTGTPQPADGQIVVEPLAQGWFRVHIGRARIVKRFNLSPGEARQLIPQLTAAIISQHGVNGL